MKRYFALGLALALLALGGARAQGPDDDYVQIYGQIQEADTLASAGSLSQAMAKYLEVQAALQRFQKLFPDWNPRIARFRLAYVTDKIAALSAKVPLPSAMAQAATNRAPETLPAPAATKPAVPPPSPEVVDLRNQLNALQNQVRFLQADKQLLEAKLKEALAVQPAAVDPRELARAEERIRALEKENDLLKVGLEQEKAKATPAPGDAKSLAEVQQALTEANRQLAAEKAARQAQLKPGGAESETLAALRAENALLKQAAETKAASASGSKAKPSRQLAEARAQLAALESERDVLRLEKLALQNRLNQKSQATAARVSELEGQVAGLKARLEVYEAKQVPFTAEELAQFNKPAPKPVEPAAEPATPPARRSSSEAITLVAQAQRYFANRQLDKAEDAYLQVLHQDKTNVVALANLAAIQLESNHLEAAETNILQALKLAPDDAYSLSILGYLRYRQRQYDAALDALGRAAKYDPQNAQVQNYLGITLAEKGLRGPAETAFRKAIQIEPNYGNAHVNLALVYVAQQPPALELARWHYQRALNAGHAREPYLDKSLEIKK